VGFTDTEKARIKHFLSYPDWVSLSASIQLGFPAGSQPLFLLEDAFKRLTLGGEDSVRRDLCECESIERQLSNARTRFKATQLGQLKVNAEETSMLRRELTYWALRLASDLGVVTNPYSQFEFLGAGGGGRNARVMG
jgi:hypothetical protein